MTFLTLMDVLTKHGKQHTYVNYSNCTRDDAYMMSELSGITFEQWPGLERWLYTYFMVALHQLHSNISLIVEGIVLSMLNVKKIYSWLSFGTVTLRAYVQYTE